MYCSYVSFSLISPKTPLDLQGIKWVGGKFRSSTDYVITYIFSQFFCTLSLRDCIDTDCSTKNTNPDSSSLGLSGKLLSGNPWETRPKCSFAQNGTWRFVFYHFL